MRMDSKCKYWMLLLTLLCVISLGFSLFRVFPCEVGNETFLGIVLSAVGIIVTLVMGYQIFMESIITDPQHPFYNRTIDEYMNSRLKPVKTIDDKIRNHKNYKFIKVSYEDIMALFNEKVSKIILDPQNLSFSR